MWKELVFSSPSDTAEEIAMRISHLLNASYSCTKSLEGNESGVEKVSVYISPHQDLKSKLSNIKKILEESGIKSYSIRPFHPERYASGWRSYFKPFRIANIWIAPPWNRPETKEDEQLVIIKPAMAFGTGLHPTTRSCIKALFHTNKYWRGKDILDVGTGTGILSICAIKLGARSATAVDIDPQALKEAKSNCKLNLVSRKIIIRDSLPHAGSNQYSLTVANIGVDELLQMCEEILLLTEKGGYIILSGITENSQDRIISEYTKQSIIKKIWKKDYWITLLFKRL